MCSHVQSRIRWLNSLVVPKREPLSRESPPRLSGAGLLGIVFSIPAKHWLSHRTLPVRCKERLSCGGSYKLYRIKCHARCAFHIAHLTLFPHPPWQPSTSPQSR